MRRSIVRQTSPSPLLSLALGLAVAVALAALVDDGVRVAAAPGLVVGVFATFLTSTSIIAAFSVEGRSRWPTPWEVLARARVLDWFAVALASVVVALLATALDCAYLDALALSLAAVGLLLGARGLWGLFSLSSDRGRRDLVVDLLAGSIRDAPGGHPPEGTDLGEIETEDHVPAWFLSAESPVLPHRGGVSIEYVPSVLRAYADRKDPDALSNLVDEVHAAAVLALEEGGQADADARFGSVDTVLGVQRRVFAELALRVLSGRLGEATAQGALVRAGETAIDIAGRARAMPAPAAGGDPLRIERLVTRHLAALCRTAGAVAAESAAAERSAVARALEQSCSRIQQAARWAVDPDPPGMKLPTAHPWRDGLSDSLGALVWLWSAAEFRSGPLGVGLYALCEILTGRKFFGSYWDGLDVWTEIERRVREERGGGRAGAARPTLERAGGMARLSLELGAARLAARDPREDDGGERADRLVASDLFVAAGGYKPAGRDPVNDLAWLLSDRPGGSLWTAVEAELGRLPEPKLLPALRPLHRRPDACALALCLRLTPLLATEDPSALKAFVAGLPDPLLEETASLARRLTSRHGEWPAAQRAQSEEQLIEAAGFVRNVVPGGPPAAPPTTAPAGEPDPAIDGSPSPPPAGVPAGFAALSAELGAAEGVLEIDLSQCDPRWLDQWAGLRANLDAALLAAALRGRVRVRRIVPFGISGDASRRLSRLQYRWSEALATAAGCFARPGVDAGEATRYRVRQVVMPFARASTSAPADCVVVRGPGADAGEAERFQALWDKFDPGARIDADSLGLVELGGRGAWRQRASLLDSLS